MTSQTLITRSSQAVPDNSWSQLAAARVETDRLFGILSDDAIYDRPLPQRHRLIFYLGHLEAFDWNQVARYGLGEPHLHSAFDDLFARGIDPEPGQLPEDEPSDWPSLAETKSYVDLVRKRVDRIWDQASSELQQTAIEHRWMHAETLAYQLHNLPHERKSEPVGIAALAFRPAVAEARMIAILAGQATLGLERGAGFGWDNEFAVHRVDVPSFAISKHKVTNSEYLAYVEEGHQAPFFWTRMAGEWNYRGMFGFVPLPLSAPVYLTQHEAVAYAKWRGMDLPTEAQFHRAAYGTPEGGEREFPWGGDGGHPEIHGNYDFRHWDPVSVTEYELGASAFGVSQLVGNGWEWTRTPFAPFPGFEPQPNYPGYSADFFDNQHFVLKGASPRTAALLTRRSLRNWFRPDYPYVYATCHLVQN